MKFKFSNLQSKSDLVGFAAQANEIIRRTAVAGGEFELDWTDVTSVDPAFIVAHAALIEVIGLSRTPYTLGAEFPRDEGAFQSLDQHGIFRSLTQENHLFESESARHFSLEHFHASDPQIVSRLAQFICLYMPTFGDMIDKVEGTLDELMSNAEKHSGSRIGGFVAGQQAPDLKLLQLAVNDFGVTIPGHLSRLEKYRSGYRDSALLLEAFKEGVTGTEGQVPRRHFGSGLPYIKDLTASLGGSLRVFSRGGMAELVNGELRASEGESPYPGTLVIIEWPTR